MQSVALRAFDLVDKAAPGFVERAHQEASPALLERQRESQARPFDTIRTAYALGLARRASKLGYATRIAEFDHLAKHDGNLQLTQFMRDAQQRHTLGLNWFETVCGTARWLLRAAHKQPHSSQAA